MELTKLIRAATREKPGEEDCEAFIMEADYLAQADVLQSYSRGLNDHGIVPLGQVASFLKMVLQDLKQDQNESAMMHVREGLREVDKQKKQIQNRIKSLQTEARDAKNQAQKWSRAKR